MCLEFRVVFLIPIIFVRGFVFVFLNVSESYVILDNGLGGTWNTWKYCPKERFVAAITLKTERETLFGVGLFCGMSYQSTGRY